jgi:hypothetical protein
MRWTGLLWCCLFLVFTFAGAAGPLSAADLKSPPPYPDEGRYSRNAPREADVPDFCFTQRQICRKICNLRFRDDFVGCPQSCDSRESRCTKTGCFKWTEPDFLIAERFGGYQCSQ